MLKYYKEIIDEIVKNPNKKFAIILPRKAGYNSFRKTLLAQLYPNGITPKK